MAGRGCWAFTAKPHATKRAGRTHLSRSHALSPADTRASCPSSPTRPGRHALQHQVCARPGARVRARSRRCARRAHRHQARDFTLDRGCQAWEPGGDEFLSLALTEAPLMSRLCRAAGSRIGWPAFSRPLRRTACHPVHACARVRQGRRQDRPSRRAEPQSPLCWRSIATALGGEHRLAKIARYSADDHLTASLARIRRSLLRYFTGSPPSPYSRSSPEGRTRYRQLRPGSQSAHTTIALV